MTLLALLAQTDLTPPGIPAWIWALLVALGLFASKDLWPWLEGFLNAEAKERRDRSRAGFDDLEKRFLQAVETGAEAQKTTAQALAQFAQAFDMFARANVSLDFALQELRRDIENLHDLAPRSRRVDRRPSVTEEAPHGPQ